MREKHKLQVYENKVLRKYCVQKDEVNNLGYYITRSFDGLSIWSGQEK